MSSSRRGQLCREYEEEEEEGHSQDEDAAHLEVLPLVSLRLLDLLEAVLHPDVRRLDVVVDSVDDASLEHAHVMCAFNNKMENPSNGPAAKLPTVPPDGMLFVPIGIDKTGH